MKQVFWAAAIIVASLGATSARAAYNLQITEIWFGNDPGNNLTEDWFEVANVGDTAWVAATDGDIWFDDSPPLVANATLTTGVASIAPGQKVVFVHGGAAAAAAWSDVWDDVLALPQVGHHTSGAGLGAGGDGVAIWISMGAPAGAPYRFESFPNAAGQGGRSYDTELDAFSTVGNSAFAVATAAVNNQGQPAIGSPGHTTPVPEPGAAALAMAVLGGLGSFARRRR